MKLLELTLPVATMPILSFFVLVAIFFISIDFILTVVSVISIYTQLSHVIIAITIISWGSSPIELINLIISAKKNELQIGLTSILSGIVFAFYILMPLSMIFKMIKRGSHEIEILQPIHTSDQFFFPAIIALIATFVIYCKTRMQIGKVSAALLILIYCFYLAYMCYSLANEKV